jgi:aldehyde dehydrogenase (NAD+)
MSSTTAGFKSLRTDSETKGSNTNVLKERMAKEVKALRDFFNTGETKKLSFRKAQLRQIVKAMEENTDAIVTAIQKDLGGSKVRGVFDMDGHEEAQRCLDNLDKWAADEYVADANAFGKSFIRKEPKGVVLLIAPWNFPIGLCFRPLANIIAAGNCCLVKPSEVSTHSAVVIEDLIKRYMDPRCVRVVQGAVPESTALLAQKWDHIMYTGNGFVARIVCTAAAKHLTPVTLELGGKSPTFVDETAKIDLAAKRIIMAKFGVNTGQICIAPDYILVHEKVSERLIKALKKATLDQLGQKPFNRPFKDDVDRDTRAFGKIIHPRHVRRIQNLLKNCGGDFVSELGHPKEIDESKSYVPPMIVVNPNQDSEILREEIFGPVLPVVVVKNLDDAICRARSICDQPLALYMYSENSRNVDKVLRSITSGGVCINSCMEQIANPNLPFGGIGESGMGSYHGKRGFLEFSHCRSVLKRTTLLPLTVIPPASGGNYAPWLFGMALKMQVTGFISKNVKSALTFGFVVALFGVLAKYLRGG